MGYMQRKNCTICKKHLFNKPKSAKYCTDCYDLIRILQTYIRDYVITTLNNHIDKRLKLRMIELDKAKKLRKLKRIPKFKSQKYK